MSAIKHEVFNGMSLYGHYEWEIFCSFGLDNCFGHCIQTVQWNDVNNYIFSVVSVFWRLLASCFLAQQARCFDIHSNHDEFCAEYVKFQV